MKNVCRCPEPPGGEAKCPAEQLAICRIVNGRIETDCFALPSRVAASSEVIANWILAAVTRDGRPDYGALSSADRRLLDQAVRQDGHARTVDASGDRVSFRLSAEMVEALSHDDDITGTDSGSATPALA